MRGGGARPDAVSYHTTIAACRKQRGSRAAARQAVLLRRRMVEDGLQPNVVACTNAMSACVDAGRWRAALALFARLRTTREPPPDTYACNAALSACAAGAQWQRAIRILATMGRQDSKTPPDAVSYGNAARACEAAGEYELAERLRARRAQALARGGREGGRGGRGGGRGRAGRTRGRGPGRGRRGKPR